MALPLLVNSADCGPVNPLQGLSKRFDQDRGLQQDHFASTSRAGPSRETFRSSPSQATNGNGNLEDAARFFGASASHGQQPHLAGPAAFDLSALHGALPAPMPMHMASSGGNNAALFQTHTQTQTPPAAWAADFMQFSQPGKQVERAVVSPSLPQQQQWVSPAHSPSPMMFSPGMQPMMQNFAPPMHMQQQQQQMQQATTQHDQILWDREFDTHLTSPTQSAVQPQSHAPQTNPYEEADELARTAALLLETVGDAQTTNLKFQNSEFLGLMRGLRDREVVVEGNEVVPNTKWAEDFQALDLKGKGKARTVDLAPLAAAPRVSHREAAQRTSETIAQMVRQEAQQQGYAPNPPSVSLGMAMTEAFRQRAAAEQSVEGEQEDPNDAYFRQENADYQRYWAAQQQQASTSHLGAAANPQTAEWAHLQTDWEAFEATSAGIKPVSQYIFQRNNPYLSDTPSLTTRHHLAHGGRQPMLDSVLELEAEVQRNMTDASAWFDLGVKQQANEREKQALTALARAVELDPSHLPAWLALAISHTNDGNRTGTYDAVRQWVDRNEKYAPAVARHWSAHPERVDAAIGERFSALIQCLIEMARGDASGVVDADIQIALAVLLNTNEDYEKAQDCFRTALAVRPDDWFLYNRVGATMANSGRAEEALQYYHRALELNPLYIRARFNLGISCLNLRRFEEAAHHILDALGLQESDSVSSGADSASGVTTAALWDSLRTASMHMQRPDLATFCDRQDLEGAFRRLFCF
ncbi:hypothetical protein R3P38DRAFT_2556191 [Favolaschia claudopus]|uniref:TPR-like protein n=1 Tax=Favolaschia claudopus TaxID=2862362 RepID=A0AAW0A9H0_9AGAR